MAHSICASIYSSILFQARCNPDAIAVMIGSRSISYAGFIADIDKATLRLNELHLQRGSRVAVNVISNLYLHWLIVIALSRLGVISISMPSHEDAGFLDFLGAAFVLTNQPIDGIAPERLVSVNVKWLNADTDTTVPFKDIPAQRGDPMRILVSSGTTGRPKKVLLTHGMIEKRLRNLALAYRISAASRLISMVGISTVAGFQVPLAAWAVGATIIITPQTRNLHTAIVQDGANFLFIAPAELSKLVDSLPANCSPIPSLMVLAGGSVLPRTVNHQVRLRLTSSLFVVYGATEASLVTYAHASVPDMAQAACGYVVPWMDVEVVDESGKPVEPGCLGEIRIRGESVVDGYLEEPETSEEVFRDGWFYPGDSGTLSASGLLSIVGRTRELMNFGGSKIAPGLIEEMALACTGVSDSAAFSLGSSGSRLMPWVAVVANENFRMNVLVEQFHRKFPYLPLLQVAKIDAIPRNPMGKIRRDALRDLVGKASNTRTLMVDAT